MVIKKDISEGQLPLPEGNIHIHCTRLFVLALTSSFRLLFTLYRRLLVCLSLTNLSDNAGSCTLLLEPSECAFQRFIVLDSDFSHLSSLPSAIRQGFVSYDTTLLYIMILCFVNTILHKISLLCHVAFTQNITYILLFLFFMREFIISRQY